MFRLSWHVLLVVALFSAGVANAAAPSHKILREIAVASVDSSTLQTLAIAPDGKILALVAPARHGGPSRAKSAHTSEVRVFDAEGNVLSKWPVPFTAQSIGAGPDGTVFVGGDGRLAKFDPQGKLLENYELPHLKETLQDADKLRERAEEMQKSIEKSRGDMTKQFDDQKQQAQKKLDELNEKPADERTPADKRKIQRYEEQLKQLAEMAGHFAVPSIDDLIRQVTDRLRTINSVTVTDKDVFVVTGEAAGYGYSVWRMDHAFQSAKSVLTGLRGCCGQMDVQAAGNELYVAENCSHRVGRYNRDGEKIGAFGKKIDSGESVFPALGRKPKGQADDAVGFGGCCNPMNVRVGKDGRVYTAESEGIIRCFSSDGKDHCLVGTSKLSGGCKNVAVAVSPDGSQVYLCDQPGQKIIVLGRESAEGAASEN